MIESLRDNLHIPIVYLSHAIEEVARLASRVVVLDNGHVVAAGTVEGERAVEPPGDERRGCDRDEPHRERMRRIAHQDGEDAKVSDEPSRIDLGDAVPQAPVIAGGPGRKDNNAIHAMFVGILSCFLHACRTRQVSPRAGPIVDFSLQINEVACTPGLNSVTHRCLSQA